MMTDDFGKDLMYKLAVLVKNQQRGGNELDVAAQAILVGLMGESFYRGWPAEAVRVAYVHAEALIDERYRRYLGERNEGTTKEENG